MPVSGIGVGVGVGVGGGGGTLQDAYSAGGVIQVTTANGPLTIQTTTDATDAIVIDRTFAGGGRAIDVNMGTGGESVTGDALNIDMGSASTGAALRTNLVAGAAGDGLQVNDAGDGTSIFSNKTSASGFALDIQSSGLSTLSVNAVGAVTANARANAMSLLTSSGSMGISSSIGSTGTAGDVTISSDSTAATATAGNVTIGSISSGAGAVGGVAIQVGGTVIAAPAAGELRNRAEVSASEFYEVTLDSAAGGGKYRSVTGGTSTGADLTMESDATAVGATASNLILKTGTSGGGTLGGISISAANVVSATVPVSGQVVVEASAVGTQNIIDVSPTLISVRALSTSATSASTSSLESKNTSTGDSGDVTLLTSVDGVGTTGNILIQSDAKTSGTSGGISLEVHSGGTALATPASGELNLIAPSIKVTGQMAVTSASAQNPLLALSSASELNTTARYAESLSLSSTGTGAETVSILVVNADPNGDVLAGLAGSLALDGVAGTAYIKTDDTSAWSALSFNTTLQKAYNNGALIAETASKPVAITTAGPSEIGLFITDTTNTVDIFGNGIELPGGLGPATPAIRWSSAPGEGIYRSGGYMRFSIGGADVWHWPATGLQGPDGIVGNPAFTFANGSGVDGVWRPGTSLLAVSAGGVEAARWNASGQTLHPDGVLAAPSIAFANVPDTGLQWDGTDVNVIVAGTVLLAIRSSNITASQEIRLPAGVQSTPSLTFTGNLTSGLYSPSAGVVGLSTNGSAALMVEGQLIDTGADEVAFDFTPTVNKTSGIKNYTGIRLNVTETVPAPGPDNRLLDLQVDGASKFYVTDTGRATALIPTVTRATALDYAETLRLDTTGTDAQSVSVLVGSDDPNSATAVNDGDIGSLFIDATTPKLWQKTAASTWIEVGAALPDPLLLSDGAVGAPTYSFTSESNTGFYLDSAGVLVADVLGSERQRWTNLGSLQTGSLIVDSTSEIAFDHTVVVTKPTTGNYTGIKLNIATETVVAGDHRLLDLQVGGTSKWTVSNAGVLITGMVPTGALPDPLLLSSGTGAAPTYSFSSSSDTGLYRPASGRLGLTTDGVVALTVEGQLNGSGNETAFNYITTIDKAESSGSYTAMKVNANITNDDSTALNKLADWQVGSVSQAYITDTGRLLVSDGSEALPAYSFGSTDSGMYAATGLVAFAYSGVEIFRITASRLVAKKPLQVLTGTVGNPSIVYGSTDLDTGTYRPFDGMLGFTTNNFASYLMQGKLVSGTVDEVAHDFAVDVNKASGTNNYTALKVNVTETAAPGAANTLASYRVVVPGTGDTIGGTAPTMTLTDSAGLFIVSMLNGTVTITGATTGANDGTFPIVSIDSGTQLTYTNASGAAEAFTGAYSIDAEKFKVASNGYVTSERMRGTGGGQSIPAISVGDDNMGFYKVGTERIGVSTLGIRRGEFKKRQIIWDEGSSSLCSYAFLSELDTGLYLPAAGTPTMNVLGAGAQQWTSLGWASVGNLVAATGDESSFDFTVDVNKATSGGYTALDVGVTETLVPTATNYLMQMRVNTPGTGDTIGGTAPTMTLTDSAGLFINDMLGGEVTITSATTGANNGTFPITVINSGTQLTYTNASGVAEAFTGTYLVDADKVRVTSLGAMLVTKGTSSRPSLSFIGDTNSGVYSINEDRVGISTNGVRRFDVSASAASVTLPVRASDGSAAAPSYSFSSGTDVGTWRVAANQLGLAANSESVIVDNDGGVPSLRPDVDNVWSNGEASFRWTTVYSVALDTGDINLRSQDPDMKDVSYSIVEGRDGLYLRDHRTGKAFRFNMTEVPADEAPRTVPELRELGALGGAS